MIEFRPLSKNLCRVSQSQEKNTQLRPGISVVGEKRVFCPPISPKLVE
jgi:hypothetical protein